MEKKKKVLFLTDPSFLKTGLSRNITLLLKYLYKTNKYEIVHVCCGVQEGNWELNLTPWKCVGVIPQNPQLIDQLNKNHDIARQYSYGWHSIDKIIEQEKPDIFVGSNDSWSFHEFEKKEWFQKIGSILHITLDSLPIRLGQQEQAAKTKNYRVWTSFAEKELKRINKDVFKNVKTIHGVANQNVFKPVSLEEKIKLKQKFNISPDTMIVSMVSRNQLRKLFPWLFKGLMKFKKQYPNKKVKVLLNTTNEQWPLQEIITHLGYESGYEGVLKNEDILFGYFCRNCKQIEIKPLCGNDLDCPLCGMKKAQIIPNIKDCADEEELVNTIYGISDCYCHLMTSGGLEYAIVEAMLCGLPAATIPYSCGTEFTASDLVYSVPFTLDMECASGFNKAVPDEDYVAKYYNKMFDLGAKKREELGLKSRKWAIEEFSIENVGPIWERLFDSLPLVDYSNINLSYKEKPENYPLKDIKDSGDWIKDLYKGILLVDVDNSDEGWKNWMKALENNRPRQDILNYFLQVARQDNAKNKQISFEDILGPEDKKDRVVLINPESFGDQILLTSLLKDYKEQYPDKKKYLACKSQYFEVFKGIEDITLINWEPFMDNAILMESKYFEVCLMAHPLNQRFISYLHNGQQKTSIDLRYKKEIELLDVNKIIYKFKDSEGIIPDLSQAIKGVKKEGIQPLQTIGYFRDEDNCLRDANDIKKYL